MPDEKGRLYLYEALELRNEYKRRLEVLRSILPENIQSISDELNPVFDPSSIREQIERIEYKMIKLNNAIQKVNFETEIEIRDQRMTIAEALDLRKRLLEKLGALRNNLYQSGYERVIILESRDVVRRSNLDFNRVFEEWGEKQRLFREMCSALRRVSHEVTVDFRDER